MSDKTPPPTVWPTLRATDARALIRFDRARRMLPHLPGAAVAATCGYADQSHLVRDFVDFTGLAPRAWLAAEVGNLQAPDTAAGRDWAS